MDLLLWITFCSVAGSVLSLPVSKDEPFGLDHRIEPITYEIDLTFPDLDSASGEVTIKGKATNQWKEESTIKLHIGENIDYDSATVKIFKEGDETDYSQNKDEHTHHEEEEIWEIPLTFGVEIMEGDIVTIVITYNLKSTETNGIHKYSYTVDGGDTESIIATHFQPIYARNVFPCFDEPIFQATFELSLKLPEGYTALSNTLQSPPEELIKTNKDGETDIKFMKTPAMSTYMLAFVVYHQETYGSFSEISEAGQDIIFKTFAPKSDFGGTIDLGKQYGQEFVNAMESYTKIPYDGDVTGGEDSKLKDVALKHDQVALPSYSLEPMETYGIATYEESTILLPEGHSEAAKEQAVKTIAYGVAHHWFGDLVTAESWGDAWLNEGFSTLFDYYLAEKADEDDWRMEERLVLEEQMKAMEADADSNTLPLSSAVGSDDDILKQLGIIASSKGASVLRMFEKAVGEGIFKEAVQEYLKEKIGSVSTPKIFFEKLAEKSSEEIPFFESWTTSKGFPLILVTIDKETEGDEAVGLTIKQERFLLGEEKDEDTIYELIINILTNAENTALESPIKFGEKETSIKADIPEGSWVLVKSDGYYRVNYEEENWELLGKHLQSQLSANAELNKAEEEIIEPLERAVLVRNALYFAQEGILDYSVALNFVSYLQDEEDYIPWSAALPGFDYLHRMLAKVDAAAYSIDAYIISTIDDIYSKLKEQNPTGHIHKLFRSEIQELACRSGHSTCIDSAEELFKAYMDENKEVDLDLRSTVYCYGVQNKEEHWEFLWEKYIGQTSERVNLGDKEERSRYISGLGCSSSEDQLIKYLGGTTPQDREEALVPKEEVADVFLSVFANIHGREVALKTLKDSITHIKDIGAAETIISGMAKYLKTQEEKETMESLKDEGGLEHVISAAISTIEENIKWVEENEDEVNDAIEDILEIPETTSASTTAETTTDSSTSTPAETTTDSATSTPAETTTDSATSTPAETTTDSATSPPAETTTDSPTSTPAETTTDSATSTPAETTTDSATSTPAETTTDSSKSPPAETTTDSSNSTPTAISTDSSSSPTTTDTSTDTSTDTTKDSSSTKDPGGSAWNIRPASVLIFLTGVITIIFF